MDIRTRTIWRLAWKSGNARNPLVRQPMLLCGWACVAAASPFIAATHIALVRWGRQGFVAESADGRSSLAFGAASFRSARPGQVQRAA